MDSVPKTHVSDERFFCWQILVVFSDYPWEGETGVNILLYHLFPFKDLKMKMAFFCKNSIISFIMSLFSFMPGGLGSRR